MHVTSCYRYVIAVIVTTAENTNNEQWATKYAVLYVLIKIYNGPPCKKKLATPELEEIA